jgi:tripartite-type tricarboxylate transporter receptor subunit TctC
VTKAFLRTVRLIPWTLCALALGFGIMASDARAAWPERNITIIVPFPPGGPNDLLGRLLAAELSQKLGQSVIV